MSEEARVTDRVFLSGFMAAGKTAVGRALAEELGWEFRDLDEMIEASAGRRVTEIFAADGEEGFRRLEHAALVATCGLARVVVALGGGTVTRADNRHLLRESGLIVWLDTPRSTILARLESGGGIRPLYRDREQAVALLETRLEDYRDCHLQIRPQSGEGPAEIARRIARSLR